MSTRLPVITGAELIRALQRAGFVIDRINGSHFLMRHLDGRRTSVPVHAGKTLRRGLLASVLKDCAISADDLRRLVH